MARVSFLILSGLLILSHLALVNARPNIPEMSEGAKEVLQWEANGGKPFANEEFDDDVYVNRQSPVGGRSLAGLSSTQLTYAVSTGWNPPDNQMTVGTTKVIAAVNGKVQLYDKPSVAGESPELLDQSTLSQLFEQEDLYFEEWTGSMYAFDPRTLWDPRTDRYFISAVAGTSEPSFILFAVSKSSDPQDLSLDHWETWSLNGDPGDNDVWSDYPTMGIDAHNLYISVNLFGVSPRVFSGSMFYAINVQDMINGVDSPRSVNYYDIQTTYGYSASTLQHATNWDTELEDGWFVTYGSGWYIRVAKFSSPESASYSTSTFTTADIRRNSDLYPVSNPEDVMQPSGVTLTTGSTRMAESVIINGRLYFAHTNAGMDPSDHDSSRVYPAVYWYEVDLTTDVPELVDQGAIRNTSMGYFYPAITADVSHNIWITFAMASEEQFPSMGHIKRIDGVWTEPEVLVEGYRSTTSSRWGDYAGAALDPVDGTVWGLHQISAETSTWESWLVQTPLSGGCPCVNGDCASGSDIPCTCDVGWIGTYCETVSCHPECVHGTCDEGTCDCTAGWTGAACDQDACAAEPCINGGVCVGGEQHCACTSDWTGRTCDEPVCSDCPAPGECIAPGQCLEECDFGVTNYPDCDENVCSPPCQNGGTCDSPGGSVCTCTGPWKGDSCDTPDCGAGGCGSGTCVIDSGGATASCNCPFGKWGAGCASDCDVSCGGNGCDSSSGVCSDCGPGLYGAGCASTCPGGSGGSACSGNGVCDDGVSGSGTCQCEVGFSGSDCSGSCSVDSGGVVCGGVGNCRDGAGGDGGCDCPDGWSGDACEVRPCSDGCVHGLCGSSGECECFTGWNGTACNVPSCSPACLDDELCSGGGVCVSEPEGCSEHGDCPGNSLCLEGTCGCSPGSYPYNACSEVAGTRAAINSSGTVDVTLSLGAGQYGHIGVPVDLDPGLGLLTRLHAVISSEGVTRSVAGSGTVVLISTNGPGALGDDGVVAGEGSATLEGSDAVAVTSSLKEGKSGLVYVSVYGGGTAGTQSMTVSISADREVVEGSSQQAVPPSLGWVWYVVVGGVLVIAVMAMAMHRSQMFHPPTAKHDVTTAVTYEADANIAAPVAAPRRLPEIPTVPATTKAVVSRPASDYPLSNIGPPQMVPNRPLPPVPKRGPRAGPANGGAKAKPTLKLSASQKRVAAKYSKPSPRSQVKLTVNTDGSKPKVPPRSGALSPNGTIVRGPNLALVTRSKAV